MKLEAFGEWLTDHPRAARGFVLCAVAFGTWEYLRLLSMYAEFDHWLREQASDAARAASESLGG